MSPKLVKSVKEDIISSRVIRGDSFIIGVSTYTQSESGRTLSEQLNTKVKTISETDYSYRVINHWESLGLIDSERPSGKGWRKFSPLDLVWIGIIAELRRFGISNENILKVRASLERYKRYKMNENASDLFLLEYYTVLALTEHEACYVLVYNNGDAEPIALDVLIPSIEIFGAANFVAININEILRSIFPSQREMDIKSPNVFKVQDDELNLLYLLRSTDYSEITIKRKNGRIERFDMTEFVDTKRRIVEILREGGYQDLSVKQVDGKVVSIKRTTKQLSKNLFKDK